MFTGLPQIDELDSCTLTEPVFRNACTYLLGITAVILLKRFLS